MNNSILFLWVFIPLLMSEVIRKECVCDTATANEDPVNKCKLSIDSDTNNTIIDFCTCKDATGIRDWRQDGEIYGVFCDVPPTEAANTTLGRCSLDVMTTSWKNITKYLMLIGSVFISLCCVVVIILNCVHKNKGPHRTIHLLEEIVMIVLFIAMGILNFMFIDKEMPCKITTIATHFLMTMLSGLFLMEATFAQSMVNYTSKKNGKLPTIANYLIPVVLAIIPTAATFFLQKKYYAASMLHCSAGTNTAMLYGFVIPVWILIFAAGVQAQRGLLGCVKVQEDSDEVQVYWGYKSAKVLFPMASLVCTIYICIMFGVDQQKFWVLILTFIMMLILGPYIFVAHTFCHVKTAVSMHPRLFGIYTPCPKPNSANNDLDEIDDLLDDMADDK